MVSFFFLFFKTCGLFPWFYLFALFRGVARSQKTELEHPLTASVYYSVFYDLSPFLGGLSGSLGAIGVSRVTDYLLVVAYGTFLVTFFVDIVTMAGLREFRKNNDPKNVKRNA